VKRLLLLVLLAGHLAAQNANQPKLPTTWVDNNEMYRVAGDPLWNGVNVLPQYEWNLATNVWTPGQPSCGVSFSTPGNPPSASDLLNAVNQIEACRTGSDLLAHGPCTILDIPPALYTFTTNYSLLIPQTATQQAICFLELRSTMDASLHDGTTVCSHGIQDNLATTTAFPHAGKDPLLYNYDCTGTNMFDVYGAAQIPAAFFQGFTSISMSGSVATFNATSAIPASYTPGQYFRALSIAPPNWNTFWQITSGGAGTTSMTAQACVSGTCVSNLPSPTTTIYNVTSVTIQNDLSTATYVGSFAAGTGNGLSGNSVSITGFTANAGNNGQFDIISSTTNNLVVALTTQVAETAAASAEIGVGVLTQDNQLQGITTITVNTIAMTSTTGAGNNYVLLRDGYVSPGTVVTFCIPALGDTGCAPEQVTALAGPNQQGIIANFANAHAAGEHVQGIGPQTSGPPSCVATGCMYTLRNGQQINTASYNDLQYMYQLQSGPGAINSPVLTLCTASGVNNGAPLCSSAIGPDHWLIKDAAIAPTPGVTNNINIAQLGSGQPNTPAQNAAHFHMAKDWIHGDWRSLVYGSNQISNAIQTTAQYSSIVDSAMTLLLRPGAEGHTIVTGQGFCCHKFNHNFLEGQSIGFFCGGFAGGAMPHYDLSYNYTPCTDLELRRNHLGFDYRWIAMRQIPMSFNANFPNQQGGNNLTRKNILEQKGADRTVREGLIGENSDQSGGQNGTIGDWNVWGGFNPDGSFPFVTARLQNVYEHSNIYRNVCTAFEMGARGQGPSNQNGGGGAVQAGGHVWIDNDLVYNVNPNGPGCGPMTNNSGGTSLGHSFSAYAALWIGNVTRAAGINTFTATCAVNIGAGTTFCPPPGNMQQTQIAVNDELQITGCSDPTFNTPLGQILTVSTTGQPYLPLPERLALTGTSGVNVVYNNTNGTGDPDGSVTDQSCTLGYTSGIPRSLQYTHTTMVSSVTFAVSGAAGRPATYPVQSLAKQGGNFGANALFRNDLWVGGGFFTSSPGEGNPTEVYSFNRRTLTFDNQVWTGRNANLYTQFSSNPFYPAVNGQPACAGSPYVTQPATDVTGGCAITTATPCTGQNCSLYFPATMCSAWTTIFASDPASQQCTAGVQNIQVGDYHAYSLASTARGDPTNSPYTGGQPQAASDGTDMGANLDLIDQAQLANIFVCPYACGSPGPYPDLMTGAPPPPTGPRLDLTPGARINNAIIR
jgi:hypothetical protein